MFTKQVRVVRIEQTALACPTQFKGVLEDGRLIYFSYRGGELHLGIGRTEADVLKDMRFLVQLGSEYDGALEYEELKRVFAGQIVFPYGCNYAWDEHTRATQRDRDRQQIGVGEELHEQRVG